MGVSLSELLPGVRLHPDQRVFILRTVRELPIPAALKVELLVRWSLEHDVTLTPEDFTGLRGGPVT